MLGDDVVKELPNSSEQLLVENNLYENCDRSNLKASFDSGLIFNDHYRQLRFIGNFKDGAAF